MAAKGFNGRGLKHQPVLAAVALLCLVILVRSTPTNADDILIGRASVIDGDTLEIRGQRIRLHAIDAPEASQACRALEGWMWPCGRRAALALADRIGTANVSCRPTDQDRYGRIVAICSVGEVDLNAWLVGEGWALAYRQYGTDYVAQESEAQQAGQGVWSSEFVPPWRYRRGDRLPGEGSAPGRKPIPFSDTVSEPEQPAVSEPAASAMTCGSKTTCDQMKDCAEARYFLEQCGVRRLDGDRDGEPCERLCM